MNLLLELNLNIYYFSIFYKFAVGFSLPLNLNTIRRLGRPQDKYG